MSECGERVGRGTVTYPCTLTPGHDGPHKAMEIARSVAERKMWEEDRPGWEAQQEAKRNRESGLAQFQGPALTTAQSKTEGALPHPDVERYRLRAERERAVEQQETGPVEIKGSCPRCWQGDHAGCIDLAPEVAIPTCACFVNDMAAHTTWVEQPEVMCGLHHETHIPAEFGPECFIEAGPVEVHLDPSIPVGEVHLRQPTKQRERQFMDCPNCTSETGHFQAGCIAQPTKTREGDQRLPVASEAPISHREVQADLEARLKVGIERYGQPLQAHNGRNSFLDAYEEVLDTSVYLKTLQIERADFAERIRDLLGDAGTSHPEGRLLYEILTWLEQ